MFAGDRVCVCAQVDGVGRGRMGGEGGGGASRAWNTGGASVGKRA
jgi:hypothetical protein